jgi:hypothetical protein
MAKGQLRRRDNKFGFIADLGTTEKAVTIGSQENIPYLSAAATVGIASTDTNDTSAGTGARTVEVSGLDANFADISETVTLNGQTKVDTTQEFLRVTRLKVLTAGSGDANAGVIHCGTGAFTLGVPAVKLIQIAIGDNQTLFASYTVPQGVTAHLRALNLSGGRSTGATQAIVTVEIVARETGAVFQVKWKQNLIADNISIPFMRGAVTFPSGSDVEARAVSTLANTNVGASMTFDLIEDN